MEITTPFIKEEIKLGDAIKALTSAVGIKPCGGCGRRAEKLNRAVSFVPPTPGPVARVARKPAQWTVPPEIPDGWELEDECGSARLFRNVQSGARRVWNVADGQYRDSHTFCCGGESARAELARRCQS
jgi:hypothetical protein